MSMNQVEEIDWKGKALAYIIRGNIHPEKTTFLTPPEFKQQVGFIVYPAGGCWKAGLSDFCQSIRVCHI
jgi:hypothetical protein